MQFNCQLRLLPGPQPESQQTQQQQQQQQKLLSTSSHTTLATVPVCTQCIMGCAASSSDLFGALFALAFASPKVVDTSPSVRVDKPVRIYAATTSLGLSQHGQALKAKPGVAVSAKHFVALYILRFLFLDILFA